MILINNKGDDDRQVGTSGLAKKEIIETSKKLYRLGQMTDSSDQDEIMHEHDDIDDDYDDADIIHR